ncbi:uncharacterized protein LOC126772039 [Nymphalis io]|uniref:uncharacterized protein LOC126772039 n=1 Tax=Inachis io TaxID=171585 RepID=UPI002168B744|nr:uncharacterized protein LOC126772039 [Nymphalis io]
MSDAIKDDTTDIKQMSKHSNESTNPSKASWKDRKSAHISANTLRILRFGSILQTWTEVSNINYMSALTLDEDPKEQRFRSISFLPRYRISPLFETLITLTENGNRDSIIAEQFPANVTSLLNEDQLWGCFYNFPELYDDIYSPVVPIRNIEDIPEIKNGVLTRDVVTACLSYLKRTPIMQDYVYIKLNLSSKYLINIDALKHYKYLVYLDLSSNLLTDLKVLSNLLYLQYLSVDFNKLKAVLDYETPQWFLTEVHYKYNSVMNIRELKSFWSITILDLSHNNIKYIEGLQNLRYLRRLDLSFNHIQRLENLNHLRLTWLDVSYNNISSFEYGSDSGLWTLLHLESLNISENKLTSLKLLSGCTRLRELRARNNCFNVLLELAIYMSNLRSLILLDLSSNPICNVLGYKDVVYNKFPKLLELDDIEVDPVEQRAAIMDMSPDIITFATRRLLRLLYIQQLSRARVSPFTPPADTTDIPIVVIVGYEAVGKGSLARRLAAECASNIELALQHTTACHFLDHYKVITRRKFDDMLLAGDLLTYSEMDGESYGLSREEAFVKDGKVKVVTMDLIGALMLRLRGYRPYLILASCSDKQSLSRKQQERREARNLIYEKKMFMEEPVEISTLQILMSGRLIINGILNELIQTLSDENDHIDFIIDSECSLKLDSEDRKRYEIKAVDRIAMTFSSTLSLISKNNNDKSSLVDSGMYSLYKEQPGMDEYTSNVYGLESYQDKNQQKRSNAFHHLSNKQDQINLNRKSIEDKNTSSTWRGKKPIKLKSNYNFGLPSSRKSSKSVAFTSPENTNLIDKEIDSSELLFDPQTKKDMDNLLMKSISAKVAWPQADGIKPQDDLWLAFLLGNGLLHTSSASTQSFNQLHWETQVDGPDFIVNQPGHAQTLTAECFTTIIRDDYEEIHRKCPGLFWDTVNLDNPDAAFKKMKTIIKNIVNSQRNLKPMFDINFTNLNYPVLEKKLMSIYKEIAPQRLFY